MERSPLTHTGSITTAQKGEVGCQSKQIQMGQGGSGVPRTLHRKR
jgi:hypothetical protein